MDCLSIRSSSKYKVKMAVLDVNTLWRIGSMFASVKVTFLNVDVAWRFGRIFARKVEVFVCSFQGHFIWEGRMENLLFLLVAFLIWLLNEPHIGENNIMVLNEKIIYVYFFVTYWYSKFFGGIWVWISIIGIWYKEA